MRIFGTRTPHEVIAARAQLLTDTQAGVPLEHRELTDHEIDYLISHGVKHTSSERTRQKVLAALPAVTPSPDNDVFSAITYARTYFQRTRHGFTATLPEVEEALGLMEGHALRPLSIISGNVSQRLELWALQNS